MQHGDVVSREELRGQEEFVVELALTLVVGGRVHELDEGAGEDGGEASVTEARVKGVGGTSEDGEGEAVRWGGGGRRRGVGGGTFAGEPNINFESTNGHERCCNGVTNRREIKIFVLKCKRKHKNETKHFH